MTMSMQQMSSTTGKLKNHVQSSFDFIRKALAIREKLLLRQIDALEQSQKANRKVAIDEIKFIPENELKLLTNIREFGKFNLDSFNMVGSAFINEDDICPTIDHDIMYKNLKGGDDEQFVLDFNGNKELINENANTINESIINLILTESKELIEKSKLISKFQNSNSSSKGKKIIEPTTGFNRHGNNSYCTKEIAGNRANICQSANSKAATKAELIDKDTEKPKNGSEKRSHRKKRFSSLKNISNLTINNCYSGTLNLKNISQLTINNKSAPSSKGPISEREEVRDDSPKINYIECDFYNRLIKENKLLQPLEVNNKRIYRQIELNSPSSFSTTSSTSIQSFASNVLNKNKAQNHKMTTTMGRGGVNEEDEYEDKGPAIAVQPVQIQQWLQQISGQIEIEPVQNAEFLEYSRINECLKD